MVQINATKDLEPCLIRSPVPAEMVRAPPTATLGRLFFARLRLHKPDSVYMAHAVDTEHRRITYGELFRDALGLAHGLLDKLGLRRGDRLAIATPNHELYFMVNIACLFSGVVLVPMLPHFTAEVGAHLLMEAKPHAVVAHSSLYPVVRESLNLAKLAPNPHVLLLDSPPTPEQAAQGVQHIRDLIVPGQAMLPSTEAQLGLDDTAIILFTTGTTGTHRKAVQVTHRMILSTMVQLHMPQKGTAARSDDPAKKMTVGAQVRHDGVAGFYHLSGTLVGLSSALLGSCVYFFDRFDVGDWLAAVQTHKITHAVMTPSCLVAIMKDPRVKQFDVSSLEQFYSVAAPLSGATQKDAMEILGVNVIQGYGSTEALAVAMPHWGKGAL
ncbi:hypothetical protein GGF32_002285, partial [Allomyces javanicus]